MASTTTTDALDISFDSAFGKAIPLLIGKCVIVGTTIWTSTTQATVTSVNNVKTSATAVSFAVAFGKPDPSAASSYVSRLWLNGTLAYDATGKSPVTSPGLKIALYPGDEAQQADPLMSATIGKTCPALRGIMYAVIQGVDFTNLDGVPNVVAEIVQTNNTKFPVYSPKGSVSEYRYGAFNSDSDTLSMVSNNGIDVFDVDAEALLYTLPFTENGSPLILTSHDLTAVALALPGNRLLITTDHVVNAGVYSAFLVIDLATGIVLSRSADLENNCQDVAVAVNGAALVCGFNYYAGLYAWTLRGDTITQKKLLGNERGAGGGGDIWGSVVASPVGDFAPWMKQAAYAFRSLVTVTDTVGGGGGGTSLTYHRPEYATTTVITPAGGKVNSDVQLPGWRQGQALTPGHVTVTAPDPSVLFDPVDPSLFDVLYVVKHVSDDVCEIWRYIDCGGRDVILASYAPLVGTTGLVRGKLPDGGYVSSCGFLPNGNVTAEFADPELGEGALGGYSLAIAGEATIDWRSGGDRFERVYTAAKGELILALVAGSADDAYVGAVIRTSNGDVFRRFDTVWSRKATASAGDEFDTNYYIAPTNDQGDTYNDNVSLVGGGAMRAAVHDYFAPLDDVAIPRYPQGDVRSLGNNFGTMRAQEPGPIFAYGSFGSLVLINADTLAVTVKDTSNFVDAQTGNALSSGVENSATYDAVTGLIFNGRTSTNFYLNAGVPLGDMLLSAALRSLLLMTGFTADQIDVHDMVPVDIQGIVVNQTTTLTSILDAFRQVFSLDIFDTDNQVNFVRKARGAKFVFDMEVSADDLLPADEGDAQHLIKYDRAYSGDLPTTQTLEYIDGSSLGAVGTQTARRTKFPNVTTNADQSNDLSAPVIMSTAAAIYWCNAILFDLWASSVKATLRLGPEGFALDPGDYLAVNYDDGTQDAFRVSTTTLNADRTVSVEATSLVQYNDFDGPGAQAPTISVKPLGRTTAPVQGVFENILFKLADDDGNIPLRFASDQACALSAYETSAYVALGAVRAPVPCGKLVGAMPVAGETGSRCVWETDNTSRVLVRFRTKPPGLSGYMAVGAPGRWELVRFAAAVAIDATGLVWAVTGLVRGRRGTEKQAATGQAGDAAVFLADVDRSTGLGSLPASLAGLGVPVRLMPAGGGAATAATIVAGATRAPWAPCGLAALRSPSATIAGRHDLAFSWRRRTRDETDTLHDGDGNVTNEFGAEVYSVAVTIGSVVHIERDNSGAAFVYTAEMAVADGVDDPTTLLLSVAQVGNGLTGVVATKQFTF